MGEQVYLNNLDVAAEYSVRLIDELLAGPTVEQGFFLPTEIERARIAVMSVRSIEERFRAVLKVRIGSFDARFISELIISFALFLSDRLRSSVQSTRSTSTATLAG